MHLQFVRPVVSPQGFVDNEECAWIVDLKLADLVHTMHRWQGLVPAQLSLLGDTLVAFLPVFELLNLLFHLRDTLFRLRHFERALHDLRLILKYLL